MGQVAIYCRVSTDDQPSTRSFAGAGSNCRSVRQPLAQINEFRSAANSILNNVKYQGDDDGERS
jgi:hypothetical protein